MADRDLTIRVDLEARRAQADLREVDRRIRELTESVRKGDATWDQYEAELRQLSGQSVDLRDKLDRLRGSVNRQSSAVGELVGVLGRYVSAAAVGLAIRRTAEWADHLDNLSNRSGLTVNTLQKLHAAATLSGNTLEQMVDASLRLSRGLGEGKKSTLEALRELNISVDQFRKLSPDEQILKFAVAVGSLTDKAQAAATAQKGVDESGLQLLGTFQAMAKGAHEVATASNVAIRGMDAFEESIARAKVTGTTFLTEVLGRLTATFRSGVNPFSASGLAAFQAGIQLGGGGGTGSGFLRDLQAAQAGATGADVFSNLGITSGLGAAPGALQNVNQIFSAISVSGAKLSIAQEQAAEKLRIYRDSIQIGIQSTQDFLATQLGIGTVQRGATVTPVVLPALPAGQVAPVVTPGLTGALGASFQVTNALGTVIGTPSGLPGRQTPVVIPRAPPGVFGRFSSTFLGGLPQVGLGALMGGGNFVQSIAGFGGGALGSAVGGGLGASGLGGILGSVLPGIGTFLGAGLGSLFGGLFGPSEESRVVNPLRDQFLRQFGPGGTGPTSGFGVLSAQLAETGDQDLFQQLINATTQGELETAIANIGTALEKAAQEAKNLADEEARAAHEAETRFPRMADAARKYGIELGALGPAFNADRIHQGATQILEDFELLTKNGADVGGVLFGMKEEISDLVQESIRFGVTIPSAMRPLIQELARSGNLLDEHGVAITDLGQLKFADDLGVEFKNLGNELDESTAKVKTDLPEAFRDALNDIVDLVGGFSIPPIKVEVQYDVPNPPTFAEGGLVGYYQHGGRIRGTDTVPAMLTPGEFVLTRDAVRRVGINTLQAINRGGAVGSMVVVNVDARDSIMEGITASRLADRIGESVMARMSGRGMRFVGVGA